MKIIFVMASGFSLSGGDRAIAIYAQHLHNRGHDVFVVSPPQARPSLRAQIRSLVRHQRWLPQPQPGPSHFDPLDVPHQLLERWRPVTDQDVPDADIVIATWWETAEWVMALAPAKGTKVYFIQHHEVFDYLPQARAAATYSLPLHKIVVAEWLRDLMHHHYGDPTVAHVPYGIDLDQFNVPVRSKQPIPTVGMLYHAAHWKGCDLSLQAVAIATRTISNLRLVAFGAIDPIPELPLPAHSEYVKQPPQAQIKDLYAKCDAWLFSSRSEGFGLPLLEAMACRTPVIGTPTGAAPELLAQGCGLLVEPENPDSIAQGIEQICQLNPTAWRALSDQAFARATRDTWDDATDRFEAALTAALARDQ